MGWLRLSQLRRSARAGAFVEALQAQLPEVLAGYERICPGAFSAVCFVAMSPMSLASCSGSRGRFGFLVMGYGHGVVECSFEGLAQQYTSRQRPAQLSKGRTQAPCEQVRQIAGAWLRHPRERRSGTWRTLLGPRPRESIYIHSARCSAAVSP